MALQYISAGTLSFLFYTYPAWVAIIARVRHSEPFTRPRLIALALSLVGVAVMVGSPSSSALHPYGVSLALGSAMIYAAYVPLIGEMQRGLTPPATATYMAIGAAAVFLLAKVVSANPGSGGFDSHLNPISLRAVLGLAIISTTAAFMLFLRGLSVLGPVRTAIVSTIEPFCTALLGVWFLGQPMTQSMLIGGVFIAAAVVLLQLRSETRA
jgi:drug/metabolite transporter (DMT)-like permease